MLYGMFSGMLSRRLWGRRLFLLGEAGRQLQTRFNEHAKDIKNNYWKNALAKCSNLTHHYIFDLSNVKILDYENNQREKKFNEKLNIQYYNKNTINRVEDTVV